MFSKLTVPAVFLTEQEIFFLILFQKASFHFDLMYIDDSFSFFFFFTSKIFKVGFCKNEFKTE